MFRNNSNSLKNIFLIGFVFTLFSQCANVVMPTGGAKDITPPTVLEYKPANNTKEFSQRKINIRFDEFFLLKDASNKYTVNPMLKYPLEFKTKNKTLQIIIKDTLEINQTYNINLDDCIQDNNENNPIPFLSYVFSTGNVIDSLTIRGNIIDAYTQLPEKQITVLLYKKNIDSLPYFALPNYYAKTDNEGNFVINNIRKGDYKVVALRDANKNYKYDRAGEKIAFVDTLVPARYEIKLIEKDTLSKQDSINKSKKIVKKDTLTKEIKKKSDFPTVSLYTFTENKEKQKLLRNDLKDFNFIQLVYIQNIENISIIPIFPEKDSISFSIERFKDRKDSILCWINSPIKDSLKIIVIADNEIRDTLKYRLFDEENKTIEKKKKKDKEEKKVVVVKKINPKPLFNPGNVDYFKNAEIEFPSPIKQSEIDSIVVIQNNKKVNAKIFWKDSLKRYLCIEHKWIQDSTYKFICKDSLFVDWHGAINDSIEYTLKISNYNSYGFLKVIIKDSLIDMNKKLLFELCDEQYKTKYASPKISGKTVSFELLNAGNYKLRIIEDANNNGKWDSGDYILKQQPEKTKYYKETIIIKSNWDTEIDW